MKILKMHSDIEIDYVGNVYGHISIWYTHKRYWISEYSK